MSDRQPFKPDALDLALRLRVRAIGRLFLREGVSFWAVCGYLFMEYVRPQSAWPVLDVLPFAQIFLVVAGATAFFDPKARITFDATHVWMALFLIVILASSRFALWPDVSDRNFMAFFGWFVIYFIITTVVRTRARFMLFLGIFLLASFKLAFHGARVWALRGFTFASWGLMGPPGPFQNSGELAVQMVIFTAISFQLWLLVRRGRSGILARWYSLLPLTGAMTVLGASSRGSQVALGGIVISRIIVNWRRVGVLFGAILISAV